MIDFEQRLINLSEQQEETNRFVADSRRQSHQTFGENEPVSGRAETQFAEINKKIAVIWSELDIPPLNEKLKWNKLHIVTDQLLASMPEGTTNTAINVWQALRPLTTKTFVDFFARVDP